jgi:hypothetical protein
MIDLGSGVTADFFRTPPEAAGPPHGLRLYHPKPNRDESCQVNFYFTGHGDGRPTWTLESEEPLTLTELVVCPSCGLVGRVTAGEWVGE